MKGKKTYDEKELMELRKSDFGVFWKIINKWVKRMTVTARNKQATPVNVLLEVRREIKEKMGKFINR